MTLSFFLSLQLLHVRAGESASTPHCANQQIAAGAAWRARHAHLLGARPRGGGTALWLRGATTLPVRVSG